MWRAHKDPRMNSSGFEEGPMEIFMLIFIQYERVS